MAGCALVIEDDPSIRQLIALTLEDEGYHVEEAVDGQEALERIGQAHPDVILLDMMMPGMDGWGFAARYQERYGGHAPVIVVTAATDPAARSAEVRAAAYVAKPFDLETLVERISAVRQRAAIH